MYHGQGIGEHACVRTVKGLGSLSGSETTKSMDSSCGRRAILGNPQGHVNLGLEST